jgi:hypothetical protein
MFEDCPPQSFSVLDVARAHRIPHRRAYDFFNFLTALGVCVSVARGSLRWIGVREVHESLVRAYSEIEVAACESDLRGIFGAGPSPTLGTLATKFASLFFFLGTNLLSIRRVARLFYDGVGDARSLERRLYLAVSFLEAVAVVEHTAKASEYRLVIHKHDIIDTAMRRRQDHLRTLSNGSLESLLSRYDERFMNRLHEERQAELARIVA